MLFKTAVPDPVSRRPWVVAGVALLLALHVVLAIGGIYRRSVTSDETAHLTAGIAYWQFKDYRFQPENGNLPQRWGALPVLAAGGRLDPANVPDYWRASMIWIVAQDFLFERGNDADTYLFLARCAMVIWSAAAGLLVFFWSRSLWGDRAALASLAFFAVSPTTLANGPLVTSDMCAAVCLLASAGAGWKLMVRPNLSHTLLAGVVIGLACVAKFSAVLLIPIFGLVIGAVLIGDWITDRRDFGKSLMRRASLFLLAGVLAIGVIWTFYGWRFGTAGLAASLPAQNSFYLPWARILGGGGPTVRIINFLRNAKLFPEPFIYGSAFVSFFSTERGAFLAGSYSVTGWWWFFPFTFLVKSTLGELALAILSLMRGAMTLARIRIGSFFASSSAIPLLSFGLVYGAYSITSHLNIGHRHILPLYLVLFILGGTFFMAKRSALMRLTGLAALLLSAAESLANFPNHLAFFNRAVGGPAAGWKLLVDSSLDWGQDLPDLADWVLAHRRPGEPVYVSAFGTADPWHEGMPATLLAPYFSLGKPRQWYELQPGIYCVSATMLQDVYGPKPGAWTVDLERDYQKLKTTARIQLANGQWPSDIPSLGFHNDHALWLLDRLRFARLCQYLRVRPPEAVINHTQFIYRLSKSEVETVTDRPFSELAELMQSKGEIASPK